MQPKDRIHLWNLVDSWSTLVAAVQPGTAMTVDGNGQPVHPRGEQAAFSILGGETPQAWRAQKKPPAKRGASFLHHEGLELVAQLTAWVNDPFPRVRRDDGCGWPVLRDECSIGGGLSGRMEVRGTMPRGAAAHCAWGAAAVRAWDGEDRMLERGEFDHVGLSSALK